MKIMKDLMYHVGRVHCPVHGHGSVRFCEGNRVTSCYLGWACMAEQDNVLTCNRRALWTSIELIKDPDVLALAKLCWNAHHEDAAIEVAPPLPGKDSVELAAC